MSTDIAAKTQLLGPQFRFWIIPKRMSRVSWETLANTWITWALNVVVFTLMYNIGPVISASYGLDAAQWGWIVAGALMVRVVCDLPFSILSDKLGNGWRRKNVWVPIMGLYSVLGALIAVPGLTHSLLGFCLLLIGVALGTTASEAIGVTATAEWWPREHAGFAVGLHHTGYPVGALIGGWWATWLLNSFGESSWRLTYLAALATIPFAIWYFFLSNPRNYDKVVQHAHRRGLTWAASTTEEKITFASCFNALKSKEVVIIVTCGFLFQGLLNVYNSSYSQYLNHIGGFSGATVASLSVVWAFTGAFFQFFWPTLSDQIGRKWLLIGAGVCQALAFALLPFATSIAGSIAVQLLYGVTLNAVYPLMFSTCSDISDRHRGSVMGLMFASMWLGGVCGTLFVSYMINIFGGWNSASGYVLAYRISIVLALIIVPLRWGMRETNPRKAESRQAVIDSAR